MLMLSLSIFFSGVLSLISVRKHYFLSLLSLEFFLVSIYFYLNFFLDYYFFNNYFLVIYLVFAVCEGVLGLSLIVYLVRKNSSDYLDMFSLI